MSARMSRLIVTSVAPYGISTSEVTEGVDATPGRGALGSSSSRPARGVAAVAGGRDGLGREGGRGRSGRGLLRPDDPRLVARRAPRGDHEAGGVTRPRARRSPQPVSVVVVASGGVRNGVQPIGKSSPASSRQRASKTNHAASARSVTGGS
jgi:hypothetical protein